MFTAKKLPAAASTVKVVVPPTLTPPIYLGPSISPSDVQDKLSINRRLKQTIEEARERSTLIKRDISNLEATLRDLSAFAPSRSPGFELELPNVWPTPQCSYKRSIWALTPAEVHYNGNHLLIPPLPPLVRYKIVPAQRSSGPGPCVAPHSASTVQKHVSGAPTRSPRVSMSPQVFAPRVDLSPMLFRTQPQPISTPGVTFEENVAMRSPRTPLATLRHEVRVLPSQTTAPVVSRTGKYIIPPRRHNPQVEPTAEPGKPCSLLVSSQSQNAVRRSGAQSRDSPAPASTAVQTTGMTTALLLKRDYLKDRLLEDCQSLKNPRLNDPASRKYYSLYIGRLPKGIRLTVRGVPIYNDVVGWRAFVYLRPSAGLRIEDSGAPPHTLFLEGFITLFSTADAYLAICKCLRLKCNQTGVLSSYKGPLVEENMIEEIAEHLNNCGATVSFALQYIRPFVMELKRQRGIEQGY
ncbi:uncharacterized protein BT62DRAFT_1000203 [Guyanagaster necrorhizus]|uniref:Uncharacterized protein n=1 Tax=Guyanagaster necrorhizus TaxID=856835 RepID=A0A9P8AWV2_9AGAR|nr:uncharacterized protein BT62DRAFT_1000203 [Guyanagaster necrorhizus MCA 3950]KAG7450963.1 hypothetical protein BT62DRAFT_1000203 [Guyanagaster necrorhizus MCA 3950]